MRTPRAAGRDHSSRCRNLPAGAREAFLAGSTLRAFAEDDARLFQSLASNPARAMLNEPANSLIEESSRYFAASKAGNDECVKLAFTLLARPFAGASRDVFQHIVFRLIAVGRFCQGEGSDHGARRSPAIAGQRECQSGDATRADESAFA